jgi:hypothetical protein
MAEILEVLRQFHGGTSVRHGLAGQRFEDTEQVGPFDQVFILVALLCAQFSRAEFCGKLVHARLDLGIDLYGEDSLRDFRSQATAIRVHNGIAINLDHNESSQIGPIRKKTPTSHRSRGSLNPEILLGVDQYKSLSPPPPFLSSFGFSAISASLVSSRVATLAAFWRAVRVTLTGSMTPAFTRSSYTPVAAL